MRRWDQWEFSHSACPSRPARVLIKVEPSTRQVVHHKRAFFLKKKKNEAGVQGRVEDETELSGPNRCRSQEVRPEPPPLWEETPAGALLSL